LIFSISKKSNKVLTFDFILKQAFTVPTISQFTNINYTLSLTTDPPAGPFTTTVNTTIGFSTVNISVSQWTAGPFSNIDLSFGDGSAIQSFTSITGGMSTNITHTFTTAGTYTISANATPIGLTNVTVTINTITVNVAPAPIYTGKMAILRTICLSNPFLFTFSVET
jgi:hypothetical protein